MPEGKEGSGSGRKAVPVTAAPGAQQCRATVQMASRFPGGLVLRVAPPLDKVLELVDGPTLVHEVIDFIPIRGVTCHVSCRRPPHNGLLRFQLGGAGAVRN